METPELPRQTDQARCCELVSVVTSFFSASRRRVMYLPEKPYAPVTATRKMPPD
jgi:hypothetical protein